MGVSGTHASAIVRELAKAGEVKKVDRGRYKAKAKG
jgi:Mn-dependent DtxR family transcriptional regulator